MTPNQLEHLQHQAEILAEECKRHRRTARAHSRLPRRAYAEASLATPALLGCLPTGSVQPIR